MAFICPEFKIHQAPFWMSDTMMGTVGVRGEGRAQMMKMCSDPPPAPKEHSAPARKRNPPLPFLLPNEPVFH